MQLVQGHLQPHTLEINKQKNPSQLRRIFFYKKEATSCFK